jgi:hypothetical protein
MDLGETVSSRQSHSSVSLILASLFIFVFVCDFASQPSSFASLRSWEEGRRSPNPHTAGILEKFLSDHPTVERPKK